MIDLKSYFQSLSFSLLHNTKEFARERELLTEELEATIQYVTNVSQNSITNSQINAGGNFTLGNKNNLTA